MDRQVIGMRILLTSVGKRVQLVKHLQKNNYIVGIDMSDLAPARYFVDSFYLVGAYDSEKYIDDLLRICREERVDMLIPLYEKEFFLLDSKRAEFADLETQLLLSHREILEICDDKLLTYNFMVENEIEVAKSFLLSDLIDKNNKFLSEKEVKSKFSFPLIVKPRQGMGSQGVEKLMTYEDLLGFIGRLETRENRGSLEVEAKDNILNSYLVQEFCPGQEFTVDVLCDLQGEILSIVPRKRLEVRDGEVVKARSVKNNLIIDRTRDLVGKLNKDENIKAIGPLNIQCFVDGEDLKFIEINPRFGGGVPLSFASGVNYSRLLQDMVSSDVVGGKNVREDLSEPQVTSQARQLLNFDETTMIRYDEAVYTRAGVGTLGSDSIVVDDPGERKYKQINNTESKIKGLIFDLDDTLYREWDYVFSGFNQVAKFLAHEYNLDQTKVYEDILEIFHRDRRGKIFNSICDKHKLEADISKLVEIYRDHQPSLELYEDASLVLDRVRGGYKLGIITDGKASVQWRKVRALGLENIFDIIIVSDDKGLANWKPSPGPYQDVLAELDLVPDEAIYIGDNPHKDFITARKLGMHTIRVMRPIGDHMRTLLDEEHEADYMIRDLSKLEDIITLIECKTRKKI